MVQGYKTSNSTGTSRRTTGNGYTILKGSVLFSYSGKKGEYGILSCKNDDRHPYDKRNKDTTTKLDLPELEKSDRKTGGTMLNVTGMNRFYYLRNFHDMRCKYERVLSIIHQQLMNLNESSRRLLKQNEEQQKKQDRKNLYGYKSQKISRKKKEEAPSHEENKNDFDRTSGPLSVSASGCSFTSTGEKRGKALS